MKKVFSVLFVLVFVLVFFKGTGAVAGASEGWEIDFEVAKKRSLAEGKPMLVDFTGSDWCPLCVELDKGIFSKDEFKSYAKDKFILVELDFPRGKEQDPKIKAQNVALAEKYQVQGFPTVLLMDAQGRPFARTGYREGTVEAYNEHLDEFLAALIKRDAAFAAAEKVTGYEKAGHYVSALEALSGYIVDYYYGDFVQEIYKLDPEDKTGYKRARDLKRSITELNGTVTQLGNQGKFSEAKSLIDSFIEKNKLTGELKQKALLLKIACFNARTIEGLDGIDALMDVIIALDSKTSTAQRCLDIKAQIVKMKEGQ